MVSDETLLSYPYWRLTFTVHTNAYDKQVGDFISHNNKHVAFFSRSLSNPQCNYTMTDQELLPIAECLHQLQIILFGYEINTLSDHKNLVYAATLSEYKKLMQWRLIIEEVGTNIKHIAGVDNKVSDTINRLPYTPSNKYESFTSKDQCCMNDLLSICRVENNEDFPR